MTTTAVQRKALQKSIAALERAKHKLDQIKSGPKFKEYPHLWSEFLDEFHRARMALKKASEHGPIKLWHDKMYNEQKNDPLLSYLIHARNASEHGIDEIQAIESNTVSTENDDVEIATHDPLTNTMKMTGTVLDANRAWEKYGVRFIGYTTEHYVLVPVLDRGVLYSPPSTHLGSMLTDISISSVAELGVVYFERRLKEARGFIAIP